MINKQILSLAAAVYLLAAPTMAATEQSAVAGRPTVLAAAPGEVAWFDITTTSLPQAQEFYGKLFDWTFNKLQGTDQAIVRRGAADLDAGEVGIVQRREGPDAVERRAHLRDRSRRRPCCRPAPAAHDSCGSGRPPPGSDAGRARGWRRRPCRRHAPGPKTPRHRPTRTPAARKGDIPHFVVTIDRPRSHRALAADCDNEMRNVPFTPHHRH